MGYPISGLSRGGTPSQVWVGRGYLGYPLARSGWWGGTQGIPRPELGYPPDLKWWDGEPPRTWDGVPPGPEMGYPPAPEMGYLLDLRWGTPQTWDGVPPPDLRWGTPLTWDRVTLPTRPEMGYPLPEMGYPPTWGTPHYTEQHSVHLLHGGRCASCIHTGGLSCFMTFLCRLGFLSFIHTKTWISFSSGNSAPLHVTQQCRCRSSVCVCALNNITGWFAAGHPYEGQRMASNNRRREKAFTKFHVAGMFASSRSGNSGVETVTLTPNKKGNLDYKYLGEYFSPVIVWGSGATSVKWLSAQVTPSFDLRHQGKSAENQPNSTGGFLICEAKLTTKFQKRNNNNSNFRLHFYNFWHQSLVCSKAQETRINCTQKQTQTLRL